MHKPSNHRSDRLFLALWPDEAVRQQIAVHSKGWIWPDDGVPYAPQDWHVTMRFLGAVPAAVVAQALAAANIRFQPFEWILDRPQIWPRGLAVLTASSIPEPLLSLHEQLEHVAQELGLKPEPRHFQPHVTLARHAAAARPPTNPVPVVWQVTGFVLAISIGHRDRRYQAISLGG